MSKKIKVTYTITAMIEPYGFDGEYAEESEFQRAEEMVRSEPTSYYDDGIVSITTRWVDE